MFFLRGQNLNVELKRFAWFYLQSTKKRTKLINITKLRSSKEICGLFYEFCGFWILRLWFYRLAYGEYDTSTGRSDKVRGSLGLVKLKV